MSLDDRKDTGLAEDNASETASRRRFLKVGAAAAVGAIAGAGALKTAEAQPETAGDVGVTNPDGTRVSPPAYNPSHPFNETLADAIVKAWGDPGRREQLLSDPKKTLGKDVIVLSRAQYTT